MLLDVKQIVVLRSSLTHLRQGFLRWGEDPNFVPTHTNPVGFATFGVGGGPKSAPGAQRTHRSMLKGLSVSAAILNPSPTLDIHFIFYMKFFLLCYSSKSDKSASSFSRLICVTF